MMFTACVRRWVALCVLVSNAACYTYTPITFAGSASGVQTGGMLTARAAVDYENRLGPGVEWVEGLVTRKGADSVEIQVRRTKTRNGDWASWNGEAVTFHENAFATWRQRRHSTARTALFVLGVAGLVGLAFATDLFGIGDSGSGERRTPPPEQ